MPLETCADLIEIAQVDECVKRFRRDSLWPGLHGNLLACDERRLPVAADFATEEPADRRAAGRAPLVGGTRSSSEVSAGWPDCDCSRRIVRHDECQPGRVTWICRACVFPLRSDDAT